MLGGFFKKKETTLPTYESPTRGSKRKFCIPSHLASGLPSLPFSSDGDTSPSSKYKKKRKAGLSPLACAVIVIGLVNIIVTALWMRTKGNYSSLMRSLNTRDIKDLIDKLEQAKNDVTKARKDMETAVLDVEKKFMERINQSKSDNARFKQELGELRLLPHKIQETDRRERLEPHYIHQIERIEAAVRKESKRAVLERFGIGPHHIRFTYVWENVDYDFEIELAPLTYVPHAIHLFLEQVEHGLWNNTFFYANTKHVMQAGPSYADEPDGLFSNVNTFRDLELDTLAFPDYSRLFPHEQWTVGFAARPGGPDWFINKIDNQVSHGPGGQAHYALDELGDSCFGRIVKGRENLEKLLFPLPTVGQGIFPHFLKEQVTIKHAIILTPKPDAGTEIDMGEETPTAPAESIDGKTMKEGDTISNTMKVGDTMNVGDTVKLAETIEVGESMKVGETIKVGDTMNVGDTMKVEDTVQVGDTIKVGTPGAGAAQAD